MPQPHPYRILAQRDGDYNRRFLVTLGSTQADATARVPDALVDLDAGERREIDFLWVERWTLSQRGSLFLTAKPKTEYDGDSILSGAGLPVSKRAD